MQQQWEGRRGDKIQVVYLQNGASQRQPFSCPKMRVRSHSYSNVRKQKEAEWPKIDK